MSDGAVRVLTAADEWLAHIEDCCACQPGGISCDDGERLLRRAAEMTAVRVGPLLIDLHQRTDGTESN